MMFKKTGPIVLFCPLLVVCLVIVVVLTVNGTKKQRCRSEAKLSQNGCILPNHPLNGHLLIPGSKIQAKPAEKVPLGTIINVGCDAQYTLNGTSVITCKNGTWSSRIGECLELCPPIITTSSTIVTCTSGGKPVENCIKATNGTVATLKCAPFYENSELNRNPFKVCRDGSWNSEIPTCTPICGVKPKSSNETKGNYPWNVAIFLIQEGEKIIRCTGTLINERVILTAATCVSDDFGKKLPIKDYTLAAGKSNENYIDPRDPEAQYSDIEEIFIHESYSGKIRKYMNNIAVLISKTPFNMTRRIQPACLDWNNKYSKEFNYPQIKGYVPGPLNSDFHSKLKEVIEIEIPFINDTACYNLLASKEIGNADFQALYGYDQLCSGFINSDRVPLCRMNAGAGVVAKNPYDNKYYLAAITSSLKSVFYRTGSCDNQRWGTFTQTSKHINFITEKNNLYTPIRRSYFQTSCGVKSVQAQTLIVNGKNVTKGDYPWQVALYLIDNNKKKLICGGSLINQRVILTAAHCVTDSDGNIFPKELYIAAVGKYFRKFDDPRDTVVQFSTLKDIFVPKEYGGEFQNFFADIAILVTENSFALTKNVEPVCVDWDGKYETQFLRPSVTGFVTGWGFTKENANPSEILKELEVPYIKRSQCKAQLPSDYEIYLTSDKMCSGFLNRSSSVCSGDSGGGLVFKNINDGRYYIAGIVSLSPQAPTGGCDSQHYALYTKVSEYINDFVLQKVRLYWA